MRIPNTINQNYYKVYEANEQTLELVSEGERVVKSEDATWDKDFVPRLSELCVFVLVNIFEKFPTLNQLPCDDRNLMLETLPTTLPLNIVTNLMEDGFFWQRMVNARWPDRVNHIEDHGFSWKRLYMERHLQEMIEKLSPEGYDIDDIEELCNITSSYVFKLDLRQLQIAQMRLGEDVEEEDDEDECNVEPDLVDHIDLSPVLQGLKNLTELHIRFGLLNIGSNYKKSMFQFSVQDARNIGRGINNSQTLRLLRIHHSMMDDDKCIAMLSQMTNNQSLDELEISHCIIGDNGAAAVAKFIRDHTRIYRLNLCNNKIMEKGVSAIAYVINQEQCSPLTELNLKLNSFGDEGGKYMASVLLRGVTKIKTLNMSCCVLGEETAVLLGEMLTHNKTLTSMDLSNNNLGVRGGMSLQTGVSRHKQLQYLDLRMTGVGKDTQVEINKYLHVNRVRERKGEGAAVMEMKRLENLDESDRQQETSLNGGEEEVP